MTIKQIISKSLYPVLMLFGKLNKKTNMLFNKEYKKPLSSFYNLQSDLNNSTSFSFEQLRGRKTLIVNTASNCGYTNQYDELQKLYELNANKLIILGFPANDFQEQEKGNDEEIADFCKINFGVSFPLMKKSVVIKNQSQNKIYQWLTNAGKNGWNNQEPIWNFCKYLVNEEGVLTHYFAMGVSPLSEEIQRAVNGKCYTGHFS